MRIRFLNVAAPCQTVSSPDTLLAMYPHVFQLGPWVAQSSGVMLGVAFLAGFFLARSRGRKAGIESHHFNRLAWWSLVAILIGSRLAFVGFNYDQFANDPIRIIVPRTDGNWQLSGLAMNGGLIAAMGTAWLYASVCHVPVLRLADVLAPSLGLGIFLARIGCFLNGCCYGTPTTRMWGVIFPPDCPAGVYQRNVLLGIHPIHPTQLYSAIYGLLILATLILVERMSKIREGVLACLAILAYSMARFLAEIFRYHGDEYKPWGLSSNQSVCIVLFVMAAVGLTVVSKHQPKKTVQ